MYCQKPDQIALSHIYPWIFIEQLFPPQKWNLRRVHVGAVESVLLLPHSIHTVKGVQVVEAEREEECWNTQLLYHSNYISRVFLPVRRRATNARHVQMVVVYGGELV